jgi:hypothetical protein
MNAPSLFAKLGLDSTESSTLTAYDEALQMVATEISPLGFCGFFSCLTMGQESFQLLASFNDSNPLECLNKMIQEVFEEKRRAGLETPIEQLAKEFLERTLVIVNLKQSDGAIDSIHSVVFRQGTFQQK